MAGHREGCPSHLASVTSALTGQNAAAGPDGGCNSRGAPAPPPGGTVTPQSSLGWVGSWAGRGCPLTLCPLPAEHPGCRGDHLAAAGPGRAVAGCGWSCAPSHGGLRCPAGHLRFCQGLGAGATGEGLGPPVPTHTDTLEGGGPPGSFLPIYLGPNHTLIPPAGPPHRESQGVGTDGSLMTLGPSRSRGSAVNPEAVKS